MSKTWFGHYIENIKGDDYVLFTDYVELEQKIDKLNNELDQYKNNWEELEKYINEEWTVSMFSGDNYLDGYSNGINEMKKDVLNKMKELEEDK